MSPSRLGASAVRDDGRVDEFADVPLRAAARRDDGSWSSAAGTSPSAGCPQLIAVGRRRARRLPAGHAVHRRAGRRRRGRPGCGAASRPPTSTTPGTSSRPPTTSRSTSGSPPRPRSAGSSASAPTTPPRPPRGRPPSGSAAGVTVAVLGNRDPRRSAAVRDEILDGLREGTIAARHQRGHVAGRDPGRRRSRRSRPDLDRRPQGADGGRRRGRRPAGATGAARRAASRRGADRRGQAAAGPVRPAGGDQPR